MKPSIIPTILLFIASPVLAMSFEEALQEGKTSGNKNNVYTTQQNILSDVPNYNQADVNAAKNNTLYSNPDTITNSATNEWTVNPASQFITDSNNTMPKFEITPQDPIMQTADAYKQAIMDNYSACTTVEQCIEFGTTGTVSSIQTCDKYLTITNKSCTLELTGDASLTSCALPAQSAVIDRNGKDKMEVGMSTCYSGNNFTVTVNAYGGKGACNGPLDFTIPTATVADWQDMVTLQPHWNSKCRSVVVSYKGGCSTSCAASDIPGCTDHCDFSFRFLYGIEYIRDFSFDYSPAHVIFDNEHWVNNCGAYSGSCALVSSKCSASGVKNINGFDITSPCWTTTRTYSCKDGWIDNCQTLIDQGCAQVNSTCATYDAYGTCTMYQNTYNCQTAQTGCTKTQTVVQCNNDIKCLNPNECFDTSNIPNQDFNNTVSQMSVLNEMGNDTDQATMRVFNGKPYDCSKWIASSKDCCDVSGILINGNIAGCSQTEVDLANNRDAGVCVNIGSYCDSSSFFGACLVKKEIYCCFNSKLSRIVNEQGRPQIGKTWGTPQSPDCSGMTVDELQKIDFSKIDFSEFYADIKAKMPVAGDLSKNCSGCQ